MSKATAEHGRCAARAFAMPSLRPSVANFRASTSQTWLELPYAGIHGDGKAADRTAGVPLT